MTVAIKILLRLWKVFFCFATGLKLIQIATQLVSGRTSVEEFPDNSQLTENIYSRVVYDSIWAFALALYRSLRLLN